RLHSQSANGICHFHAVDTVFSVLRQQFSFRRVRPPPYETSSKSVITILGINLIAIHHQQGAFLII
ncbi:hypothetical protein K0G47_26135, partial [Bacteroides thetaiotaomicron]|uniref:hypothetical protein n=1 Tax=Bacteroides thetaiotaomicron TaxID=818 RepID=UPI001F478FC5